MQIKYPKENKVIKISNKRPKENNQNNELKNQIERMRYQIDELETSSNEMRQNSSSSKIEQIENRITANNTAISGLTSRLMADEQIISNNSTAIGQTNNTISQISSDLQTLSNNYTTTNNQVSVHTQQISNMIPHINQNMLDIANLEEQVDQNTEDIADLKANGTGGSSCNCESDIADIQVEQIVQNNEISHSSVNLDYVKKYLSLLDTPTDPDYNPQPYTAEPENTIFQTQAEFNRKYNKTFTTTLTTPKMIFSADDQTSGALLVKVNFTANETFTGTITIYNNNVSIFSEEFSFLNESLTFEYSKTLSNITCSEGNMFYVKIVASNNTTLVMTNSYAKLTANNAEVINQISPFNVEYFSGKYYISDCSSGTAKIAEINVSDMKNMYCLDWIDTGIECLQYKTAFQTNVEIIGDRIDYYLGIDGQVHMIDRTTNTSVTLPESYLMPDWFQFTNEKSSFLIHNDSYYYNYDIQFNNSTLTYSNSSLCYGVTYYNAMTYSTAKYLSEFFFSPCSTKFAVINSNNASISGAIMHKTNVTPINLGKGINLHCYYENITSSRIFICCFAKYYNKIINYRFRYNLVSGTMTLLSPTSIGCYEEYFEGANNDYFIVKNGILKYYKKYSI